MIKCLSVSLLEENSGQNVERLCVLCHIIAQFSACIKTNHNRTTFLHLFLDIQNHILVMITVVIMKEAWCLISLNPFYLMITAHAVNNRNVLKNGLNIYLHFKNLSKPYLMVF